jgi:hypothetical protein
MLVDTVSAGASGEENGGCQGGGNQGQSAHRV